MTTKIDLKRREADVSGAYMSQQELIDLRDTTKELSKLLPQIRECITILDRCKGILTFIKWTAAAIAVLSGAALWVWTHITFK